MVSKDEIPEWFYYPSNDFIGALTNELRGAVGKARTAAEIMVTEKSSTVLLPDGREVNLLSIFIDSVHDADQLLNLAGKYYESGKDHTRTYEELVALHLGMLTSYGRSWLSAVASGLNILKSDYLGESILTNEKKGRFIDLMIETTRKHMELVHQTLEERKQFSANQGGDTE
jgi:hypothetical protein